MASLEILTACFATTESVRLKGLKALRLQEEGEYKKALKLWKEVLKKEPQNANAYKNLGKIYIQLGQTEKAKEALLKAVEFNSSSPETYRLASKILWQTGDLKGAIKVLEKGVSLTDNPDLKVNLASFLLEFNGWRSVWDDYNRVLASGDPLFFAPYPTFGLKRMNVDVLEKARSLLLEAGKVDFTLLSLDLILGKYEEALDHAEVLYDKTQDANLAAEIFYVANLVGRDVDKWKQRAASSDSVVRLVFSSKYFDWYVPYVLSRGAFPPFLEYVFERYRKAGKKLKAAIILCWEGLFYYVWGMDKKALSAWGKVEDYNKSLSFLYKAVYSIETEKDERKNLEALFSIPWEKELSAFGHSLSELSQRLKLNLVACYKQDEAEKALSLLQQVDSDSFPVATGYFYYKFGEKEKGLKILKKAACEQNNYQAWYYLGVIYEREKQEEKAEEAFLNVLDLKPNHADALNYLAYMWALKKKNLEKALEFAKKAVSMEPENYAFVDTLGWVYYVMGKIEEALPYIEKAAKLAEEEGGDEEVYSHLVEIYKKLGKLEEAAVWSEKLKALKGRKEEKQ